MYNLFWLLCGAIFLFSCSIEAALRCKKAPIDVVIPCAPKDRLTLELCIQGIKKYGKRVRRVIVVSKERLTASAEWYDETAYPFSKQDLALEIFRSKEKAQHFLGIAESNVNWIYQQFLKLYAPLVIPDISPNVLVLDADTIFLRPVRLLHKKRYALFNPGTEYHKPYFAFMKRVLPRLKRVFPKYSGISHHMLFQKCFIKKLFKKIEKKHRTVVWKALCHAIDEKELFNSSMSEYELYFNFVFSQSNKCKIRKLRWKNVSSLEEIEQARKERVDFVSCHSHLRN
jgi:hypothetical protein